MGGERSDFGFAYDQPEAVLISNPDDDPDQWQIASVAVPSNPFGVFLGTGAVWVENGYLELHLFHLAPRPRPSIDHFVPRSLRFDRHGSQPMAILSELIAQAEKEWSAATFHDSLRTLAQARKLDRKSAAVVAAYDGFLAALDLTLARVGNSADLERLRGRALMAKGELDAAVRHYEALLARAPVNSTFISYGRALRDARQFDQAVAVFRRARRKRSASAGSRMTATGRRRPPHRWQRRASRSQTRRRSSAQAHAGKAPGLGAG